MVKQCHKPSPSNHNFYRWYGYHSQMVVVNGIGFATLPDVIYVYVMYVYMYSIHNIYMSFIYHAMLMVKHPLFVSPTVFVFNTYSPRGSTPPSSRPRRASGYIMGSRKATSVETRSDIKYN